MAETTKAAESGKPIFENFKEDKLIPELMASYNKLPQEIKQGISEIKYAPSKTNKDLINVCIALRGCSDDWLPWFPYEKESEETGSEVSEDSAVENQEVVDPNAGAATDEANNGTPTNGENQEVQQAE